MANTRYFNGCDPEHVQKVTTDFKQFLASALHGMNYAKDESFADQMSIYLSLMKTTREEVQEPHIDFLFPAVTGNMSESPKTPSGKQQKSKRMTRRLFSDLPLRERIPFIVFMPLTEEGMSIELWSYRAEKHENYTHELGNMVQIPYGKFLLVRGDTVHAGGFKTGELGNPRAHFYVYQGKMGPSMIPCQRTATIYLLDKGFQSATSIKRTFLVIAQVGSFGLTLRSMAIALPSRVIIVECFWLRKNLVFRSRTKKPIKLRSFLVVKVCYC